MANVTYAEFLARKRSGAEPHGFDADPSAALYPFQREVVRFAAARGRAAIFAGRLLTVFVAAAGGWALAAGIWHAGATSIAAGLLCLFLATVRALHD